MFTVKDLNHKFNGVLACSMHAWFQNTIYLYIGAKGVKQPSCLQHRLSYFSLHPKECYCSPTSHYLLYQDIWCLDKIQFISSCSLMCIFKLLYLLMSIVWCLEKIFVFLSFHNISFMRLTGCCTYCCIVPVFLFNIVFVDQVSSTLWCIVSKHFCLSKQANKWINETKVTCCRYLWMCICQSSGSHLKINIHIHLLVTKQHKQLMVFLTTSLWEKSFSALFHKKTTEKWNGLQYSTWSLWN